MTDTLGTRVRLTSAIPGGPAMTCARCDQTIKLGWKRGRAVGRFVLANVYVEDRWNRLEHWHVGCYEEAGEPHGPPGPYQAPLSHAAIHRVAQARLTHEDSAERTGEKLVH